MAKDEDCADPFADRTFDQFWLNNVFPDPNTLFAVKQKAVSDIQDACLVTLDANVLLLPYELGAESFSKIADVYKALAEKERLYVPAQAAREFVKNRANKLRDLVKQIGDQASTLNFSFHKEIGFLENDPSFAEIKKQSEAIGESRSNLLSEIKKLRASLTDNVGADPVSSVYQALLSKRVIDLPDSADDRKRLMEEVQWRYRHKVPPGYKDSAKEDGGIGDFLIWKSILENGRKLKNDCIFVTKDLKGDWWVQGQGAFQPRIELIEEYFRYTEGRTIHFVSLSSLLELLNVGEDTVTAVKRVEASSVRQAVDAELQPDRSPSRPQSSLFAVADELESLSLADLIRSKREADAQVMALFNDSRPLKRRIESPDLVDTLDEASILELYEQERRFRAERTRLRRYSHQIGQEIARRGRADEGQ